VRVAEAVRVAAGAVAANRLRSALTAVGVVIGVLAVILLVALGQGARDEVTRTIEDLGSNLLIVLPGQFEFGQAPTSSKLELDDVDRIARAIGDPRRVAADLPSGEVVRAGSERAFITVLGVTETFPDVVVREVARGELFGASDVATERRVAVLGANAARDLFPDRDPIGKPVTIVGLRFRVVGVLAPLGGAAFGVDRDSQVLIPITTAQRIFDTQRVDAIFVKARSAEAIDEDAELVASVLRERFDEDEFSVITQEDIVGVASRILRILTAVLAAIAGISLLVGGVGVSNIMLVSVRERTREIGLRKAVGARDRDILLQFLFEAIVLTGAGGLVGIAAGIGLAEVAERVSPVPASVTGWSVVLAFGVSVAVGIGFGVWPARRAARLDPVDALRHE